MIDTSPNHNRCEIDNIPSIIQYKKYNLIGDVIEFGTFTG